MPDYKKTYVYPSSLAGKFAGRGMHCDERKVWFEPTELDGKFVLRGQGYNPNAPNQKVYAHPTELGGKLAFRTITDCDAEPPFCAPCWECSSEGEMINPVESPVVRAPISLLLSNVPMNEECCLFDYGGVEYELNPCEVASGAEGPPPYWFLPFEWPYCQTAAVGCLSWPVPIYSMGVWRGLYTGTSGGYEWSLEGVLITWCTPYLEQFWATLVVAVNLCSCETWGRCWEIEPEESCGDLSTDPFSLPPCNYNHPYCGDCAAMTARFVV